MRRPHFRTRTLLVLVAGCALVLSLLRSISPVRSWARQVQPGNPSSTRAEATLNLGFHVLEAQREDAYRVLRPLVKDPDPNVRASAAWALTRHRRHSAEVIPLLVGLLKDREARVKQAALLGIEQLVVSRTPQAQAVTPALIAVLDDPTADVRLEAARALYVIGQGKRAIPALVRLVREEHGAHRLGAMGFLQTMGTIPVELGPTLREMLASDFAEYRLSAATALIKLGKAEMAEPTLREMLASQAPWYRLRAAEMLIGSGKAEGTISSLRELAKSEQRDVRSKADTLLYMAKDSRVDIVEPDPSNPD